MRWMNRSVIGDPRSIVSTYGIGTTHNIKPRTVSSFQCERREMQNMFPTKSSIHSCTSVHHPLVLALLFSGSQMHHSELHVAPSSHRQDIQSKKNAQLTDCFSFPYLTRQENCYRQSSRIMQPIHQGSKSPYPPSPPAAAVRDNPESRTSGKRYS
ncbi:uncharacterized protein BCR38DRAFT_138499 [Pseudomassariella vexata]|uniref:Uncharacterized protein n=1 Tax=Pseudomassariella vexata TaxID=1141098 RepID=A0A1Y2EB22_9PEZI|nr:uncharacterized protein BCR38DRAFT_138499 [Pseudomassariella vexata]ORY68769.1 hypothetical protein BCR38DRAFT_138499 [Pseudomassariella vexata]